MEYGLIGAKLGHSYSKLIHEAMCSYIYDLCPLPTEQDVRAFFAKKDFKAINVTIPYKEFVMQFCDEIDDAAHAIGAVNTIVNEHGRLVAHNTDFAGFQRMVRAHGVSFTSKTVLILGTGGTQKTVEAVARSEGAAHILRASRRKTAQTLSYEEAAARSDVQIIINTTPVGMYPNNGACLLSLDGFPALEAVFDAIYNPFETRLLQLARARGLVAVDGLLMLVAQAKYAAEYFTGTSIADSEIPRVTGAIRADTANLVLIGMPSCGKTTLGKRCAKALGRDFVDLDAEIERRAGKPIAEIFATEGEAAFRDLESAVCADVCKESRLVIATGGGTVLRNENVAALRQNGYVCYIDRAVDALSVGGARPLSKSTDALLAMHAQRAPLYAAAADFTVQNFGAWTALLPQILEGFDEAAHSQRT